MIVVHHVERSFLGQVQNRLELDFSLGVEVGVRQRVQIVLRDALVELRVLLLGDVLLVAKPDGLLRVHLLPLIHSLLFGLLVLLLLFFLFLVVFSFDVVLVLLVVFIIILVGLRLNLLFHFDVDGELNELGVLLRHVLKLAFGEVVVSVFFQVQGHTRSTAERVSAGVGNHREGGVRAGLPDVLHGIVVALGRHRHLVRHQEGRVEADTELADKVGVRPLSHRLEKVRRP
mmetsp:Transcript_89396/g.252918  ORF Transcript_89396/g.252918 Transcript_89396/m.252918 type:complete len:230 (+) Transcript_89396:1200-1889(+)